MSDTSQGAGWWFASDGKWYPPELVPDWALVHAVGSNDEEAFGSTLDPADVLAGWAPTFVGATDRLPAAALPSVGELEVDGRGTLSSSGLALPGLPSNSPHSGAGNFTSTMASGRRFGRGLRLV